MPAQKNETVIPKEDAVFWMDRAGRWQNKHGAFEHAKIIDYFHSSIRRDEQGYHLSQERDGVREKVYFSYEDTPLFVFDVIFEDRVILVLNTKKRIALRPENLSIENDSLYLQDGDDRIKFAERGLLKISDRLEEDGDDFSIRIDSKRHKIKTT